MVAVAVRHEGRVRAEATPWRRQAKRGRTENQSVQASRTRQTLAWGRCRPERRGQPERETRQHHAWQLVQLVACSDGLGVVRKLRQCRKVWGSRWRLSRGRDCHPQRCHTRNRMIHRALGRRARRRPRFSCAVCVRLGQRAVETAAMVGPVIIQYGLATVTRAPTRARCPAMDLELRRMRQMSVRVVWAVRERVKP